MRRGGIALALWMILSMARAEDVSSLQQELDDLRAAITTMEAARLAPATSGDAEALTTMNRNAKMQIGGELNVDYFYNYRDKQGSDGKNLQTAGWSAEQAKLRFKMDASPDVFTYLKLNLNDTDAGRNGSDLIEECKFVWNHVRGSDWGLVFGKGEVPYGQDRTLGVIQSYHHTESARHADGPSILTASRRDPDPLRQEPDASLGRTAHPGEVDNTFLFGMNYTFREFLKFEATVFQNADGLGEDGMFTSMHENRSDDFGMQSFAFRTWCSPLEGLTLEASFLRKHSASRGDRGVFGEAAKTAQHAASFGFDYLTGGAWEFFGEYQHGWDWSYTDNYDVNIAQLGMVREITPSLKLGLMAEWMRIDDRDETDQYAKLVTSGKYLFDNGIFLILEYGYEWFDFGDAGAHAVAFRCGWNF